MIARVWLIVLCATTVPACTTIERVNVNTVAVNCDVERADSKDAAAQANASVLRQTGQGAAQFVGSLRSTVVCRDVEVSTSVDGGDVVDPTE